MLAKATMSAMTRTFILFAFLAAMVHAAAASPAEEHAMFLSRRASTYQGCYSSSTPLNGIGPYAYQSVGACSTNCSGSAVFAMSEGDACWCGDQLPPLADQVSKSECATSCTGFPSDICGGDGLWSVYTTESGVTNYGGSSSSSSSSASSSSSSSSSSPTKTSASSPSMTTQSIVTNTDGTQTVVVTVPATAEATGSSDTKKSSGGGGGGSTAGIAAGVVVGVVAIAALIGGVYFFLRRRKRIAAEEDFKQRTQVTDFMRGGNERKPPATGYSGTSDARLDPEAGRRDSVGSLADNQDYSRRILRVANPSD